MTRCVPASARFRERRRRQAARRPSWELGEGVQGVWQPTAVAKRNDEKSKRLTSRTSFCRRCMIIEGQGRMKAEAAIEVSSARAGCWTVRGDRRRRQLKEGIGSSISALGTSFALEYGDWFACTPYWEFDMRLSGCRPLCIWRSNLGKAASEAELYLTQSSFKVDAAVRQRTQGYANLRLAITCRILSLPDKR